MLDFEGRNLHEVSRFLDYMKSEDCIDEELERISEMIDNAIYRMESGKRSREDCFMELAEILKPGCTSTVAAKGQQVNKDQSLADLIKGQLNNVETCKEESKVESKIKGKNGKDILVRVKKNGFNFEDSGVSIEFVKNDDGSFSIQGNVESGAFLKMFGEKHSILIDQGKLIIE